eukprot:c12953_g1_i4.p2 GENE.c12953_g1_i4~~c12953_g1_i4.p2  ORF type:complete len:108 (+),score=25.87 c12953_g1_i4:223-546(+)
MSKAMQSVLDEYNMTTVMLDCYANDCLVCDAKWVADFILSYVQDGSIILIHMPERGFREWNFEAIALTLQGLQERNLRAVTVSELISLATGTHNNSSPPSPPPTPSL